MNLEQVFALASQHFQSGQIAAAEQIYWQVLQTDPQQPKALHGLGFIALQSGAFDLAIDYIERAIQQDPLVADFYYNLAAAYTGSGQIELALQQANEAIKLNPGYADVLDYLIYILRDKAQTYIDQAQFGEAILWLQKALQIRPDADIFFTLGDCYKQNQQPFKAAQSWRKALEINPGHPDTFRELPALYTFYVPSWHFPMMNDESRNLVFQRALEKVVNPNSVVLDIGAGSGLLAMMAARAGAKRIYTCEEIELIAFKAQEIIRHNGYQDQIKLFPKRSTEIAIPADLPQKADILVTETFGTGLLEEHALDIIEHALQHLLKPDAVVIPKGAALYLMLLESEEIYGLHRIQSVSGFDLSPFNEFTNFARGLWPGHINHYQHKPVSEIVQVEAFDFLKSRSVFAEKTVTVRIPTAGKIHAVCLWFDLYLDDEITLTTNPNPIEETPNYQRSKCWGQRVQTLDYPIPVEAGDAIAVKLFVDNNTVFVAIPPVKMAQPPTTTV